MPSIDKLRHNIRHAVSLSAFSPNLIHRIRYFFSLYSYFPRLLGQDVVPAMTKATKKSNRLEFPVLVPI